MKWHAMLSDLSSTFTAREGCYPQVRDGLCLARVKRVRKPDERLIAQVGRRVSTRLGGLENDAGGG